MTDQKADLSPRELDAEIEYRVFNGRGRKVPCVGDPPWTFPQYSTTGDGMLLMLEAMRERGWHIITECEGSDDSWAVDMLSQDDQLTGTATADSLPRAVALAALAALEKEAT